VKTILDQTRLQRRARLAHALSLGGLLVMLGSVALSLMRAEQTWLSSALLIMGFALSAVGIYQANRWVRKPRPEVVLEKALAGLSDRHRLYHYLPFCDHLLLAPTGLVVMETVNLDGAVSYRAGKWRRRISPRKALRSIFDERLGDPVASLQHSRASVSAQLASRLPAGSTLPITGLVVFTHAAVDLKVDSPPLPVVTPKKLARTIQGALQKETNRLSGEQYQRVREILEGAGASNRE
jgi:hypothetical protein